ncbi:sensor histidine kinase [Nocardia sp. NPDC050406]|uniref:sensor histidine kinase n=1 Tax=Nocardia sp. NPDC050406 TaxID=3364318 RepID=UPI0037B119DC
MRRRLLIALTLFAALAVLAFAIPLCLFAASNATQHLVGGRTGDADRFATLADTAATTGDIRALASEAHRYHDLFGEPVLIVDARGETLVNAGADLGDPTIAATAAAARRNQRPHPIDRLTPWGPDTLLIARPVGTGAQVNGAVLIQASTARARTDITTVWAIVAAGALAAMAVCTGLALLVSRWVLRPLARLSDAVAALTATLPKPRSSAPMTRRYGGPPEVRAVAESVDTMALAVRDSLDAQQRLIADTAHAMRNPLAALTIRLDSLQPAIPDTAATTFTGATREVERLTALLDDLLTLAVAEEADFDTTPTGCDATHIAQDRADAWHTAFTHAGLTLTTTAPTHADTTVPATTLTQILDIALSNSSRYAGPGAHTRILVELVGEQAERQRGQRGRSATAAAPPPSRRATVAQDTGDSVGERVAITVVDDGVGVSATELDRLTTRFFRGESASGTGGSGLGLPIAAALTKTNHGTLRVSAVEPHGLAVRVEFPAAARP